MKYGLCHLPWLDFVWTSSVSYEVKTAMHNLVNRVTPVPCLKITVCSTVYRRNSPRCTVSLRMGYLWEVMSWSIAVREDLIYKK